MITKVEEIFYDLVVIYSMLNRRGNMVWARRQ